MAVERNLKNATEKTYFLKPYSFLSVEDEKAPLVSGAFLIFLKGFNSTIFVRLVKITEKAAVKEVLIYAFVLIGSSSGTHEDDFSPAL